MLPAPLDLKKWFSDNVETYLGVAPTSTSPQPVHVLNGFFHNVLTGTHTTGAKAAIDLVATGPMGWTVASDALRGGRVGLPHSERDLAQVRRVASGLLAADRAVFKNNASFQLAHLGMVTSDPTHLRLGSLAARLALEADTQAELTALCRRLREPQPNAHWALQAVLAEPGVGDDWEVKAPVTTEWWATDPACAALAVELGGVLRRVIRLSTQGCDALLGLETLAVAATWCGLVAFAQTPALSLGRGLQPLLVEAGTPGALGTVRDSSARALDGVHRSFANWLADRLSRAVAEAFEGVPPSPKTAREYLRECKPFALSGGSKKSQERLPEIFDLWSAATGGSTFSALGLALQDGLIASMGDKPRKWFSAVGRHCGFIGPRRGYPARFRVEVGFAPTLVLAGMADEDGSSIPFPTWLSRLDNRFGLHFGPGSVPRAMVPRASEHELEANQGALASLLAALGMARRYNDGVTEVLNPLHTWAREA